MEEARAVRIVAFYNVSASHIEMRLTYICSSIMLDSLSRKISINFKEKIEKFSSNKLGINITLGMGQDLTRKVSIAV